MSEAKKDSLKIAIIWAFVLILFIWLFFSGDGPSGWASNRNKKLISAVLFGLGYLLFFLVQYRHKKNIVHNSNLQIQLRASNFTLIIIVIYVFVFSVSLYVFYGKPGMLPVGWMWFLGYTAIFITYIVNSILLIFLTNDHEEEKYHKDELHEIYEDYKPEDE